jgi:hypothetical protein
MYDFNYEPIYLSYVYRTKYVVFNLSYVWT